jgi:hypothetical protein
MKYKVEQVAPTRWFFEFEEKNKKGEKICDLALCEGSKSSHSLPKLWKKNGYMDRVLENYWGLEIYVTKDNDCYEKYNPQIRGQEINFEWMFEATEKNKEKLLNEVYRLAMK